MSVVWRYIPGFLHSTDVQLHSQPEMLIFSSSSSSSLYTLCERVRESAAVVRKSALMETDWGKGKGHSKRRPQKTPSASKWLNIPPASGRSKSNAPRRHLQQKSISIFRTRDLIKICLSFFLVTLDVFRRKKMLTQEIIKGQNGPHGHHVKMVFFYLVPFSDGPIRARWLRGDYYCDVSFSGFGYWSLYWVFCEIGQEQRKRRRVCGVLGEKIHGHLARCNIPLCWERKGSRCTGMSLECWKIILWTI